MDQTRVIADEVFAKLVAGTDADVPGLGSFSVQHYKAYEGRNPRTGERVSVPRKRLPFFRVDDAARAYLNDDRPAPSTPPWVAATFAELAGGKLVVFGRVGGLLVRRKPAVAGRDPKTHRSVEIPAPAVLLFIPSRQLKRRLNDEVDPRIVDSVSIDAMLARIPTSPPRTLGEFDVALGVLGIDYRTVGLVEPAKRNADGEIVLSRDADDEPIWVLEDTWSCNVTRKASRRFQSRGGPATCS